MLPHGIDDAVDEHPYLADLATVLYPLVLCAVVGLVLYGGDLGLALRTALVFTGFYLVALETISRIRGNGTAFRTLDPDRD